MEVTAGDGSCTVLFIGAVSCVSYRRIRIERRWNETDRENVFLQYFVHDKSPTGLRLNPRSRGDSRATNRLIHGMNQFISNSSDHQPEEQCNHPHSPVN